MSIVTNLCVSNKFQGFLYTVVYLRNVQLINIIVYYLNSNIDGDNTFHTYTIYIYILYIHIEIQIYNIELLTLVVYFMRIYII
jgi:hypothetical protein